MEVGGQETQKLGGVRTEYGDVDVGLRSRHPGEVLDRVPTDDPPWRLEAVQQSLHTTYIPR